MGTAKRVILLFVHKENVKRLNAQKDICVEIKTAGLIRIFLVWSLALVSRKLISWIEIVI